MPCQLCIRGRFNDSPTRSQPGDVIEVVRSAHIFSFGERNCGHYRFISVPDANAGQFFNLIEHNIDPDTGALIAFRKVRIALQQLNLLIGVGGTSATKVQIDSVTVAR